MATVYALEGASALPAIVSAVLVMPREAAEAIADAAIARLDELDPDPDIEPNGDERDGSMAEDDFCPQNQDWKGEPGCPISDPDTGVEDDPSGIDPEEDFGAEELGELDETENGLTPDWGIDPTTSLPDELVMSADRAAMRPHRDRIRRTRCWRRYHNYRDWRTGEIRREPRDYRLYEEPKAPLKRNLFRRKRGVPRRPRG